uniref:Uncharacterized protein n=1 Tax=Cannabis sativa TaxID=3483 RepID=A0A803PFC9_CANSA
MTFCSEIGEWSISSWLPYSLLWPNLVEYPKLEGSVARQVDHIGLNVPKIGAVLGESPATQLSQTGPHCNVQSAPKCGRIFGELPATQSFENGHEFDVLDLPKNQSQPPSVEQEISTIS